MEQCEVIGTYILDKRKQCGYTQQQVADYLKVSCQAVSKWEKGISYPSVVVLKDLAQLLGVSVDEILSGKDQEIFEWKAFKKGFEFPRYRRLRRNIQNYIQRQDERLLHAQTPFATLYKPDLEGMEEPVIAFMVNNIGSKLKMAIDYGYHEVVGEELVNRLVNELLVRGASPLLLSQTMICGNIDGLTLDILVKGLSDACKANGVTFAGSEVSFQPDACTEKEYSMTAGIIGIIDKSRMIDGHKISEGDVVIGIRGEGCTSNVFLQRIIEKYPELKRKSMDGRYFIEEVIKPSKCYYKALEEVISEDYIHGIVHLIKGIAAQRYYEMVPNGLSVEIDLSQIRITSIYQQMMEVSGLNPQDLVKDFNLGIGMLVIVDAVYMEQILVSIMRHEECYYIGKIVKGEEKVSIINSTMMKGEVEFYEK